jgi:hypothetical protein
MPPEMIEAVARWGKRNKIDKQSAAIRALIEQALAAHTKARPSKKPER